MQNRQLVLYNSLSIVEVLDHLKHPPLEDNYRVIRLELKSTYLVGYIALKAAWRSNSRIVRRLVLPDGNRHRGRWMFSLAACVEMPPVMYYCMMCQPRYVLTDSDRKWLHHAAVAGLTGAVPYLCGISYGYNAIRISFRDYWNRNASMDRADSEDKTALFRAARAENGFNTTKADQGGRARSIRVLSEADMDGWKPDVNRTPVNHAKEGGRYRDVFVRTFKFPSLR
ncbi:hypothetical protein BDV11DRAFT_202720 [Aspergillus similis]